MSSIDQKELKKFAKISSTWWNENGEFGILHQINPIRLDYIINKVTSHYNIKTKEEPHFFSNLHVLDVGCGGGLISTPLSKLGFKVTAIDALEDNIHTAKHHAQENNLNINYLKATIEELPENKLYDIITCLEVIEHVDNLPSFIHNIIKHLKPNGMIIISTINRSHKAYILSIIVAEYLLGLVPKGTHDYSKFIKPSEIYEIIKNSAVNIKELKGLVFDIRNNQWQLSDDIDVNYFMYLRKE
jgi:2-polyprenyl-6-hydroxyphenyl methylase/3-demethylubiquinone-9 3-methyltransferase